MSIAMLPLWHIVKTITNVVVKFRDQSKHSSGHKRSRDSSSGDRHKKSPKKSRK